MNGFSVAVELYFRVKRQGRLIVAVARWKVHEDGIGAIGKVMS